MTKADFLKAYRAELVASYGLASDDAKLERYMLGVRETITTQRTLWVHYGDATTRAWRAIGGTGKPSIAALRALPTGELEDLEKERAAEHHPRGPKRKPSTTETAKH